jgi:hypothetical protein
MNLIEKVMVHASSHVKLALAVVALVLVRWATGSPLPSLWIALVVIVVLWTAIQFGLRRIRQRTETRGCAHGRFRNLK